jgi:hypothetical protein
VQIKGLKGAGAAATEIHHIATNKSSFWSSRFKQLFDPAGIGLDDAINKIAVTGHNGGHGYYNLVILNRLQNAVAGLDPSKLRYKRMLRRELLVLRREIADESSSIFGILQSAASRSEEILARGFAR